MKVIEENGDVLVVSLMLKEFRHEGVEAEYGFLGIEMDLVLVFWESAILTFILNRKYTYRIGIYQAHLRWKVGMEYWRDLDILLHFIRKTKYLIVFFWLKQNQLSLESHNEVNNSVNLCWILNLEFRTQKCECLPHGSLVVHGVRGWKEFSFGLSNVELLKGHIQVNSSN